MAKRKRTVPNGDGVANGHTAAATTTTVRVTTTKEPDVIAAAQTDTLTAGAIAADTAAEAVALPPTELTPSRRPVGTLTLQIVAGSYDRILHGVTVTIPALDENGEVDGGHDAEHDGPHNREQDEQPNGKRAKAAEQAGRFRGPVATFADSFLFSAHTAAIRCLALSTPSAPAPTRSQTVLLASGGTDERINVYALSAYRPRLRNPDSRGGRGTNAHLSAAAVRPILENNKNREMGTLLHHAGAVTSLCFPTRSKLMSSSEDSTVAVTRTRDWQLLQAIRSPVPRIRPGRPSGDTAPTGAAPSGVVDFAIHPSLKLMLTLGRGERCMRLWNLVTGRRAGALEFPRDLVRELVGRGRESYASGEGRAVVWNATAADGDEFTVVFDRDAIVFNMDCLPKCRVLGHSRSKLHRLRCLSVPTSIPAAEGADAIGPLVHLLAASTEDGRILFVSTERPHLRPVEGEGIKLPVALAVAQIGRGSAAASTSRIKDFVILQDDGAHGSPDQFYVVAGSSDGRLRVWLVPTAELLGAVAEASGALAPNVVREVGTLLGEYQTHNRITCVAAFVMIDRPDGLKEDETEFEETEFEETEFEFEEGEENGA